METKFSKCAILFKFVFPLITKWYKMVSIFSKPSKLTKELLSEINMELNEERLPNALKDSKLSFWTTPKSPIDSKFSKPVNVVNKGVKPI